MRYRHEIGKSVIIHETEPGIDHLYVERMRDGREEEMETYLAEHKSDLLRARTCRFCMQNHVPGELRKESFALGWVFGNTFDDICIACYSELILKALREMENEKSRAN